MSTLTLVLLMFVASLVDAVTDSPKLQKPCPADIKRAVAEYSKDDIVFKQINTIVKRFRDNRELKEAISHGEIPIYSFGELHYIYQLRRQGVFYYTGRVELTVAEKPLNLKKTDYVGVYTDDQAIVAMTRAFKRFFEKF